MYSRSERVCIEPNKATSENIGPGYYECPPSSPDKNSSNSSAPFLQKSPRVCYFDELAKNSGPAAPGSFDISDSDTAHRVVKAVPFAASQSPRFAQTPSTTPGPGSYTTSNVDGKFINSADKDRKSHKFNDTKKKKIVWKRKFMPPSIPYGAQAYGYEETEDGQLVLRRSGHKAESDPKERLANHGDFLRANAGTYFGKSTSRRYVWEDNGNPAPGMYNISKPWNISTIKNFRQINSQTCVRFGEYVIADALRKAIPGPGTYNAQAHPSSESPKCVPFGKSPARTSKPPVTPFAYNSQPSDTLTPGPCSYDVAKATLSKKPMHVSRKPFDSSGYRFSSIVQTCAPGPGKYEIASQIVKEENRTPTSAFGSVSERFMPPTRVDTPGPAEYQKPTEKKKKKKTIGHIFSLSPDSPKPVFLSRQSRFQPIPKDTPSPGHYNVAYAHKQLMKKGKIYHHASTSKRELFAVEQDDLPGPSDYNPPITFADHPSGSPFRSKLPRFPVTKHSFPASNQYLGHSDFIKKTFNKLFSS